MATTLRARTRAAAVVVTSFALTAIAVGPVAAASRDMTVDDGEERGTPMSIATAFLLFVVVPLAVAAVVWLLVKAPGWKSSTRMDDLQGGGELPSSAADRAVLTAGAADASPESDTPAAR
jgi:hypothetical protein